jgi:hypothetical protein
MAWAVWATADIGTPLAGLLVAGAHPEDLLDDV